MSSGAAILGFRRAGRLATSALFVTVSLTAGLGTAAFGLHAQEEAPAADEPPVDPFSARVEERLAELRSASADAFVPSLERAYALFRDEAMHLRFEHALPLMRAIHEEVVSRGEPFLPTSAWSATQLALVATRSGAHEEAEQVASERIAAIRRRRFAVQSELAAGASRRDDDSERSRLEALAARLDGALVDLFERRALGRLAAGDRAGALDDLGAGIALGSPNARLILGRDALRRGARLEARRLFETLLAARPAYAWAERGWALTMLPGREPASRPPGTDR